ncbi:T9SS type A sorting domain-containing protein [Polaribacter gochangensis]|uniref:T9SS type A sorting domain-containing protein n=1 Tax=Polaribacter gochangensis TaxID=3252903 RepID=UPI003904E05D
MKTKILFILSFLFAFSLHSQQWQRTGGPIGGLGYNIKIHPTNNQIIYITDALSGIHKSIDGGNTWVPKNNGITSRNGDSNDAIPVFTVAIDQNNPTTIWAGTQYDSGIYKSTDSGENWTKKNNGIIETNIVFREISVVNGDSNTLFASGEIPTGNQGNEFEKVNGVIYKSTDGGENWTKIWSGDSLARWLCIGANPINLVSSTGIFDREASNTVGMGIMKSTDGGTTWNQANTGITGSLFIGGMSDAATPGLLYIATGNNAEVNLNTPIKGGVFKSTNGGTTWTQVISSTDVILPGYTEDVFNAVKIAPSDNNIVYAASAYAFYRSNDAGATWTGHRGGLPTSPSAWGPNGIRAGVPIEITIDKTNPDIVYAANYGGGIFKSTDGAKTWQVLGTGYSGATIHKVLTDAQNPQTFLTIGRSGPFKSTDNGATYDGLFYKDAYSAEWYGAAIHPTNSNTLFISDEHEGLILKSTTGGTSWTTKFNQPTANASDFNQRHGAKEIVISKSNPTTMYAGFAYQFFYSDPDNTNFPNSFGVYKSTDAGETWTQSGTTGIAATNLNITALAVNTTDENSVYIGLRGDGLFHSTDGGANWTNISQGIPDQTIHGIALADNNSIIYAVTKSKGVYKSTDNGSNWTQVLSEVNTSTDFPTKLLMAIAVNPTNKNNIIVGDIHTGAYMTTDAGVNWTNISQGLTNRAITSLAFSSGGKTLYTGTKGGGIFSYNTSTLAVDAFSNLSTIKKVYPNPSSGKITLDLQSNTLKSVDIEIYTILGKRVLKKTYKITNNKVEINIEHLSKGMYVVSYQLLNGQKEASKILIE